MNYGSVALFFNSFAGTTDDVNHPGTFVFETGATVGSNNYDLEATIFNDEALSAGDYVFFYLPDGP